MRSELIKSLLWWLFITLATVVILALLTLAVMLLWNGVMPKILLCDEITFWQSLLLIALCSILTTDKSKLFSWLYE